MEPMALSISFVPYTKPFRKDVYKNQMLTRDAKNLLRLIESKREEKEPKKM